MAQSWFSIVTLVYQRVYVLIVLPCPVTTACQDGRLLLPEVFQGQLVGPVQQGLSHHRRHLPARGNSGLNDIWANYHISLTWISRPCEDDFPYSPWFPGLGRSQGSVVMKFTQMIHWIWGIFVGEKFWGIPGGEWFNARTCNTETAWWCNVPILKNDGLSSSVGMMTFHSHSQLFMESHTNTNVCSL